ncbi:MAG: shikimate dehydrogenase [Rhodospirillales bacterium]|nr:shikimate dehydrogenase [Alphaproteobacteria bacterium]MCB1840463.1 shikimate dehydrogenase [Alphaproteobacteria bacterium]MCB9977590.1 shikimate dehydrogenase [Rhodospirillales bacterium]
MTGTKTGLVGHPVSHSKSPLIHGYWIRKYGLNGSYSLLDLSCEGLQSGIEKIKAEGFRGFNITVPHKVALLDLCDEVNALARAVGAVNTVTIENGRMSGTNTDVFGFIENIKSKSPTFDFKAGPAVVLGAGGAARAVVQGLLMEGVPEILLSNRTESKADTLIETASEPNKIKRLGWNSGEAGEAVSTANLLVNTTSLGMTGKPKLEIDLSSLNPRALVHDIVYAPLMTELLLRAQERGNPIVTGIGMLLHQARPAFSLWHGVMPDVTDELEAMVTQ